jgi:hypothetical protein
MPLGRVQHFMAADKHPKSNEDKFPILSSVNRRALACGAVACGAAGSGAAAWARRAGDIWAGGAGLHAPKGTGAG